MQDRIQKVLDVIAYNETVIENVSGRYHQKAIEHAYGRLHQHRTVLARLQRLQIERAA